MSEGRDIYHEPKQKVLLRTPMSTKPKWTTKWPDTRTSFWPLWPTITTAAVPRMNAQAMVGKSKRGEVAFRLFGRINPETRVIEAAGFKTRGCLAMTGCASATCAMIEGHFR